jgi:hypothetical protein
VIGIQILSPASSRTTEDCLIRTVEPAVQCHAEIALMADSISLYPTIRELNWSGQEKTIAKKAFQLALDREFERIISEVKNKVNAIEEPSELWELEAYLTAKRKMIDRQYDYRYSMLITVFGDLIRKRRLTEQELEGLSKEKLEYIRRYAKIS